MRDDPHRREAVELDEETAAIVERILLASDDVSSIVQAAGTSLEDMRTQLARMPRVVAEQVRQVIAAGDTQEQRGEGAVQASVGSSLQARPHTQRAGENLVAACIRTFEDTRHRVAHIEDIERDTRRAFDEAYGNVAIRAVASFLRKKHGTNEGVARALNARTTSSWAHMNRHGSINARVLMRLLIQNQGEIELPTSAELQRHGLAGAMSHLKTVLHVDRTSVAPPEFPVINFLFFDFASHGIPLAGAGAELATRFSETLKAMREEGIPAPAERAGDLVEVVREWGEPFVLALAIMLEHEQLIELSNMPGVSVGETSRESPTEGIP